MKKKRYLGWLIVILAVGFLFAPLLEANTCRHKSCKFWGASGLEEMFFHKAHFFLSQKEELGLSEEQVKAIKALKLETKKNLIRANSEIEVLALDIRSMLKERTVPLKDLEPLILKKYALKKDKAVALARALASLKSTLKEDQYEKLEKGGTSKPEQSSS